MQKLILAIDAGTTESGYALMSDEYELILHGKADNNFVLGVVMAGEYDEMVYEQFQSYNMPIGASTISSIEWNGRFVQAAFALMKPYSSVYRKDEKIHFCNSVKAKDANIHRALIERFARFDFKSGKGTKKNPDFFYGVNNDAWTAIGIAVLRIDTLKGRQNGYER